MKNKEIIKRVDKAIEELIAIKVALTETEQKQIIGIGFENKVDVKREEAIQVINVLSKLRIKFKLSKKPLKCTSHRINLIKSRFKESSAEEAVKMILSRFIVWGENDKNKQYLTIETLFRPSKYFKYVDEIENIEKTISKSYTNVDSVTINGDWTDN